MAVNLKVNLGTVNYVDWIHVTASKISAPTVVVWEDWLDAPLSNYNFIIPGLDPENYYIRYYDAPTDTDLGTLVAELIVNALTGEFIFERRFYTCGGSNPGDPADGASTIEDPYLIGKNVTGVFKEGFRYWEPNVEYSFDDVTGIVSVLNLTTFATDEKIAVEIKYNAAPAAPINTGGLYFGTLDITEATRTLLNTEANKRCRCVGTASTQVITLCSLASIAVDNGFYFDNSCGGVAVQVKILTNGTDRINFNGFFSASNEFDEFWVSKGEHLLIRKVDDDFWEVMSEYKGTNVGERLSGGYKGMPNTIPEDGSEIDGNEYGRLWWWINNVLPASHYISDDSGSFNAAKRGQFLIKPTTKKIIMPNTQSMTERGLADFNTYGGDIANRPIDYPGGFQNEMILAHGHTLNTTDSPQSGSVSGDPVRGTIPGTPNTRGLAGVSSSIEFFGGTEQRLKNIGVIFLRRI